MGHRINLIGARATLATIEPKTFGPLGLKSEHVPLHLLRPIGEANIASILAVAINRWLSQEAD